MNGCPAPLSICMSAGFVFEGEVQQIDRATKQPVDWPVGTQTRMRISWGTGTEMIVPGTVDGSWLEFMLTGAETEQIPRGALITLDVNYDGGDPLLWRPWRAGRLDRCA
jgi:hypothetical protein